MDANFGDVIRTAGVRVVGTAVALVVLCAGAGAAYGSRAGGSTPTRSALAAAVGACNWEYNHDKPRVITGAPILAVARGPYVGLIYVKGKKVYDCVSDGNPDETGAGSSDGIAVLYAVPSPDQLGLPVTSGGSAPGFPGCASNQQCVVQHNIGRAGRKVVALAFVFAHDITVAATVQNGWYFAWWPNSNEPRSVRVTTSSGTVTSRMDCDVGSKGCVWAGTTQPYGRRTESVGWG